MMARITMIMLFVLYMINYADKTIAGYSAVPIMAEFSLSQKEWGLVGSSFFWFFSIAGILGAALSDRIGTKKMLAIMALSWTVIQFGAYAIAGLPMLVIARVLLGIGEGPFWATVVSHLNKWFPEEKRGLVYSTVNFGAFVGAVASAPLIVSLIDSNGWRFAWAFMGALSLIWLLIWLWVGKDRPQVSIEAAKTVQALPKAKWSDLSKVFLSSTFLFSFLIYFAQMWGTTFAAVWEPVYLVQVIHLTNQQMAYAIAGMGLLAGLMTILISWTGDRLYKKHRSYRKSYVLVGGASIILGGICFYAVTLVQSLPLVLIALCLGKGFAFSVGTAASVIVSSMLPERTGLLVGTLSSLVTLAGIISPLVTGSIVQAAPNVGIGFGQAMIVNALLFVGCGVLFLLFAKREENKTATAAQIPTIS
ncbi:MULTISPECIES: MFS transporter [Brevibacillus]|jgi:Sugar phosphate permease|uniref:MFS transporter n=1 Tax=Brevibacillus parabrevis TaxID=54914 RepID=A0A4Y3PMR3_BREPA|nr:MULTISPECIES: MFS transporter [Brevibacillus]MBU8712455.1 MFS transporter [Brevibacillus parabrevis]MDR5002443.1 MFS transporter [Brevibacillus parabrevis]MED2257203.1 MFS transporter [Brevibacillus parabrevis]NRQ52553.1 MFS transporter [Brevibacillus sp. HD1.4A]RNB96004.1 MFS transporter [Brevibacillus parabrevis]